MINRKRLKTNLKRLAVISAVALGGLNLAHGADIKIKGNAAALNFTDNNVFQKLVGARWDDIAAADLVNLFKDPADTVIFDTPTGGNNVVKVDAHLGNMAPGGTAFYGLYTNNTAARANGAAGDTFQAAIASALAINAGAEGHANNLIDKNASAHVLRLKAAAVILKEKANADAKIAVATHGTPNQQYNFSFVDGATAQKHMSFDRLDRSAGAGLQLAKVVGFGTNANQSLILGASPITGTTDSALGDNETRLDIGFAAANVGNIFLNHADGMRYIQLSTPSDAINAGTKIYAFAANSGLDVKADAAMAGTALNTTAIIPTIVLGADVKEFKLQFSGEHGKIGLGVANADADAKKIQGVTVSNDGQKVSFVNNLKGAGAVPENLTVKAFSTAAAGKFEAQSHYSATVYFENLAASKVAGANQAKRYAKDVVIDLSSTAPAAAKTANITLGSISVGNTAAAAAPVPDVTTGIFSTRVDVKQGNIASLAGGVTLKAAVDVAAAAAAAALNPDVAAGAFVRLSHTGIANEIANRRNDAITNSKKLEEFLPHKSMEIVSGSFSVATSLGALSGLELPGSVKIKKGASFLIIPNAETNALAEATKTFSTEILPVAPAHRLANIKPLEHAVAVNFTGETGGTIRVSYLSRTDAAVNAAAAAGAGAAAAAANPNHGSFIAAAQSMTATFALGGQIGSAKERLILELAGPDATRLAAFNLPTLPHEGLDFAAIDVAILNKHAANAILLAGSNTEVFADVISTPSFKSKTFAARDAAGGGNNGAGQNDTNDFYGNTLTIKSVAPEASPSEFKLFGSVGSSVGVNYNAPISVKIIRNAPAAGDAYKYSRFDEKRLLLGFQQEGDDFISGPLSASLADHIANNGYRAAGRAIALEVQNSWFYAEAKRVHIGGGIKLNNGIVEIDGRDPSAQDVTILAAIPAVTIPAVADIGNNPSKLFEFATNAAANENEFNGGLVKIRTKKKLSLLPAFASGTAYVDYGHQGQIDIMADSVDAEKLDLVITRAAAGGVAGLNDTLVTTNNASVSINIQAEGSLDNKFRTIAKIDPGLIFKHASVLFSGSLSGPNRAKFIFSESSVLDGDSAYAIFHNADVSHTAAAGVAKNIELKNKSVLMLSNSSLKGVEPKLATSSILLSRADSSQGAQMPENVIEIDNTAINNAAGAAGAAGAAADLNQNDSLVVFAGGAHKIKTKVPLVANASLSFKSAFVRDKNILSIESQSTRADMSMAFGKLSDDQIGRVVAAEVIAAFHEYNNVTNGFLGESIGISKVEVTAQQLTIHAMHNSSFIISSKDFKDRADKVIARLQSLKFDRPIKVTLKLGNDTVDTLIQSGTTKDHELYATGLYTFDTPSAGMSVAFDNMGPEGANSIFRLKDAGYKGVISSKDKTSVGKLVVEVADTAIQAIEDISQVNWIANNTKLKFAHLGTLQGTKHIVEEDVKFVFTPPAASGAPGDSVDVSKDLVFYVADTKTLTVVGATTSSSTKPDPFVDARFVFGGPASTVALENVDMVKPKFGGNTITANNAAGAPLTFADTGSVKLTNVSLQDPEFNTTSTQLTDSNLTVSSAVTYRGAISITGGTIGGSATVTFDNLAAVANSGSAKLANTPIAASKGLMFDFSKIDTVNFTGVNVKFLGAAWQADDVFTTLKDANIAKSVIKGATVTSGTIFKKYGLTVKGNSLVIESVVMSEKELQDATVKSLADLGVAQDRNNGALTRNFIESLVSQNLDLVKLSTTSKDEVKKVMDSSVANPDVAGTAADALASSADVAGNDVGAGLGFDVDATSGLTAHLQNQVRDIVSSGVTESRDIFAGITISGAYVGVSKAMLNGVESDVNTKTTCINGAFTAGFNINSTATLFAQLGVGNSSAKKDNRTDNLAESTSVVVGGGVVLNPSSNSHFAVSGSLVLSSNTKINSLVANVKGTDVTATASQSEIEAPMSGSVHVLGKINLNDYVSISAGGNYNASVTVEMPSKLAASGPVTNLKVEKKGNFEGFALIGGRMSLGGEVDVSLAVGPVFSMNKETKVTVPLSNNPNDPGVVNTYADSDKFHGQGVLKVSKVTEQGIVMELNGYGRMSANTFKVGGSLSVGARF